MLIETESGDQMYLDQAYRNNCDNDFADFPAPLLVLSCGHYRLKKLPILKTDRPQGRRDFQLLYIASGKAHFVFDQEEHILPAGSVVLIRPHEAQHYFYLAEEFPEVYWIHFSGTDVQTVLQPLGSATVFHTGVHPEYPPLFQAVIRELRLKKPFHQEILSFYLSQLILLICRHANEAKHPTDEIARAMQYFTKNYQQKISIEAYAKEHHMSVSKLIRSFKQYTGQTPMQYLLSIRMTNAQHLLEHTGYNISEIAAIVGLENPLYFSRLFKKRFGVSPLQYRNSKQNEF